MDRKTIKDALSHDLVSAAGSKECILDLRSKNYQIEALREISKFKYNWNGYGAPPIPKRAIRRAKKIVRKCRYDLEVFPTMYNAIRLELDNHLNERLNLDVFDNRYVEIAVRQTDGTFAYHTLEYWLKNVLRAIDNFYIGALHVM